MKHITEQNLLKRWQEIGNMLPELTKVTIGYNYLEMILSYTLTKIDQSDRIELEKLLTSKLSIDTGIKIMGSLAQHWEQIGETKGIQIGDHVPDDQYFINAGYKMLSTMWQEKFEDCKQIFIKKLSYGYPSASEIAQLVREKRTSDVLSGIVNSLSIKQVQNLQK